MVAIARIVALVRGGLRRLRIAARHSLLVERVAHPLARLCVVPVVVAVVHTVRVPMEVARPVALRLVVSGQPAAALLVDQLGNQRTRARNHQAIPEKNAATKRVTVLEKKNREIKSVSVTERARGTPRKIAAVQVNPRAPVATGSPNAVVVANPNAVVAVNLNAVVAVENVVAVNQNAAVATNARPVKTTRIAIAEVPSVRAPAPANHKATANCLTRRSHAGYIVIIYAHLLFTGPLR